MFSDFSKQSFRSVSFAACGHWSLWLVTQWSVLIGQKFPEMPGTNKSLSLCEDMHVGAHYPHSSMQFTALPSSLLPSCAEPQALYYWSSGNLFDGPYLNRCIWIFVLNITICSVGQLSSTRATSLVHHCILTTYPAFCHIV